MARMAPHLSLSTSLLTGTPNYHDKVTILGSRKRKSIPRRRSTNQVSPRKRQHFSNSDSDDDDDCNRVTGPVISTDDTTIAHSPIRHTHPISSDESDIQQSIKHTKQNCLILSDEEDEASYIQSLSTRTIHHISSDEECGINDKMAAKPTNGNVAPSPPPFSAWSLEKHCIITRPCSVVIDKLPIGAFRFGMKETKMNKQRTCQEKSASSSKRELLLNKKRSIIHNYPSSPEIPLQNDPVTKQYSPVTDDRSPVVKETPPHKQYSKQSVDVLGLSSSKILFDISDPKCDHSLENETASNNDNVLSMQLQDCGKHAKSVNKRKPGKSLKRKIKMPGSASRRKEKVQDMTDDCPVGSLLELDCPVTVTPLDELITMPVKQSRKRTKKRQQEMKESLPIMEPAIEFKAKRNHRKKKEKESLEKTTMKMKEKSKQPEREPSPIMEVTKTIVRKKNPRRLESDQESSLEEETIETKMTKKAARKNTKQAKQQPEREPSPIMEVTKTIVRKKNPRRLESDQESSLEEETIETKMTKKAARKNTKQAKQQPEREPLLILENIVENKLKRKPYLIRRSSSTVSVEDDPSYTGSSRSSIEATPIDDDAAGISLILHEDNNGITLYHSLRPCTRSSTTVNEDNRVDHSHSLRSHTRVTPINISETTPTVDRVDHSCSLRSRTTRATLVSQATQTTPIEKIEFSHTSKLATPTNNISDHIAVNKSKRTTCMNGKSTNNNRMRQSVHINKDDHTFNNNGPTLLVEKVPQTITESSNKSVASKGRPLPPQFHKPPLHDRSLRRKEQKGYNYMYSTIK